MRYAILILGILTYFVLFSNLLTMNMPPIVKAGDVWVVTYGAENPFEKPKYDTLYILECRGDWMRYRQGERIKSARKRILSGEKRIKRNQYFSDDYGNK